MFSMKANLSDAQIDNIVKDLTHQDTNSALERIGTMQFSAEDKEKIRKKYLAKAGTVLKTSQETTSFTYSNSNTLRLTKTEFDKLNAYGVILVLMGVRIFLGMLSALSNVFNIYTNAYSAENTMAFIVLLLVIVFFFKKNKGFLILYVLMFLYTTIVNLCLRHYPQVIAVIIIEGLCLTYLFHSECVAVLFKTKQIQIVEFYTNDMMEEKKQRKKKRKLSILISIVAIIGVAFIVGAVGFNSIYTSNQQKLTLEDYYSGEQLTAEFDKLAEENGSDDESIIATVNGNTLTLNYYIVTDLSKNDISEEMSAQAQSAIDTWANDLNPFLLESKLDFISLVVNYYNADTGALLLSVQRTINR